jgi:hypothetical protein
MSTDVKPNSEEKAALDRIDTELKKLQRYTGAKALTPQDLGEVCKIYHIIKGPLEIFVAYLKKLGGAAATAAAVIETLMKLADAACPV